MPRVTISRARYHSTRSKSPIVDEHASVVSHHVRYSSGGSTRVCPLSEKTHASVGEKLHAGNSKIALARVIRWILLVARRRMLGVPPTAQPTLLFPSAERLFGQFLVQYVRDIGIGSPAVKATEAIYEGSFLLQAGG